MDNVNQTLYIPLYGKAYVSERGLFLHDPKAEEIWSAEGFSLSGKAKSKWLAYYMGMRSAVFDDWVREKMRLLSDASVLHIGCGMDSRVERVGTMGHMWYDVDFHAVICERRRYYRESNRYCMLAADVRNHTWLDTIPPSGCAIVVMEGVSMYLAPAELKSLLERIAAHFDCVSILMDCYTDFAAKASKYKNPINDVGVSAVYGLDDPRYLEDHTGIAFVKKHELTPARLIDALQGTEKLIFKKIFAGRFSHKLYRLYEYRSASF